MDGIVDLEVDQENRREQEDQEVPLHELDRDNLEVSFVFQDARRKLRLGIRRRVNTETRPLL